MTIATTSSAADAAPNHDISLPGVLAKSARTPGYHLVAANAAKGTDKSVCATSISHLRPTLHHLHGPAHSLRAATDVQLVTRLDDRFGGDWEKRAGPFKSQQ